jgi:hypothetical protein
MYYIFLLSYIIMSIRTNRNLVGETPVTKIDLDECEPESLAKEDEIIQEQIRKYEIPPKKLFNFDLKKLKSFKKIRQAYKKKNLEFVFVNDLSVILNEYTPVKDYEFCDELLVQIMNIAEEYFIQKNKTEREESKTSSIKKLMLPYYRDDEKLLDIHISHLYHKVKKSNIAKRMYQRTKNFFFQK